MPDILLPGMSRQYNHILRLTGFKGKNICIFGSKSTPIASMFLKRQASAVSVIVEHEDDLLEDRASEWLKTGTSLKLMNYANTDFPSDSFDYIYAQAALVGSDRRTVLKEMYRLLKPGGELSLGDIILFKQAPPVFNAIFKESGMKPIEDSALTELLEETGFTIKDKTDISDGLTTYYKTQLDYIEEYEQKLSPAEKKDLKKELAPYKHECKSYFLSKGHLVYGMQVYHCVKPGAAPVPAE